MKNNSRENKSELESRRAIRRALEGGNPFETLEIPSRSRSRSGGNGHFPYEEELERFLTPPSNEEHPSCLRGMTALLEDKATCKYKVLSDKTLYLPQDVMRRNVAVFGVIGSGKTQRVMIPLMASEICDPEKSLVVLGTKGDEYDVLCNLAEQSRPRARVECLNLADAARSTLGWNPFASTDVKNREGAARDNAEILLESSAPLSDHETRFFRNGAVRLIAGIILVCEKIFGVARLVDVFELLESARVRDLLFKQAQKDEMKFLSDFCAFLGSSNNNVQTTIMEAQNAFQRLIDADLAAVTSQNDFKFDSLFDEPTILVLEVPQDTCIKTRPFVNMFFGQLFDAISRRAKQSRNREIPRPLSIYIDDFAANVGNIPGCAQRLNMMRSMNARVVLAMQSSSQLRQFYSEGEAEAIIAACSTKIYTPPVSLVDARSAAEASGSFTLVPYDHEEEDKPRRRVGFERTDVNECDSRSSSDGYATTSRTLLLPSEVQYSPENEAYEQAVTIFLPGRYPFQAWLPYAYQIPDLKKALDEALSSVRTPNGVKPKVESRSMAVIKALSGESGSVFLGGGSIDEEIEKLREQVDYHSTSGSARKWWDDFEKENANQKEIVLKLFQELADRKATISEFFLAYVYSNTDNIQANLYYLDYNRIKKEEDRKKRERWNEPTSLPDDHSLGYKRLKNEIKRRKKRDSGETPESTDDVS